MTIMIDFDELVLEALHAICLTSTHNSERIQSSVKCACYNCGKTFLSARVVDYVEDAWGSSGICPHCGLTTVIGDAQEFDLTPALRLRLRAHWLEHGLELIARELENQGRRPPSSSKP